MPDAHKDGLETFVIRPGFQGNVEEFGMLIPFPDPPAIRKVSDDIFPQIEKAIDPPEVIVNLYPPVPASAALGGGAVKSEDASGVPSGLQFNQVRVLREEAVGMYEVAVLEAGSAAALQKWMDDHEYRFPQGMDEACNDYVADGWCFVAVKTRVGDKGAVDPKPGMRDAPAGLPAGASFDGFVQAMGFRFHSEEVVVPMRLSSFNAGELRNVVYLLTDGPKKIRAIPEEYVVRQLSGEKLLGNVTEPLPLRILGGTVKDIPQRRMEWIKSRRDPVPHNGQARDLFASDLLAGSSGNLSHAHEEQEKRLLRIGESLSLRGPDVDRLNHDELATQREAELQGALADLSEMTLTVVDGDFPRELLASQNLSFGEYEMPARRNNRQAYDVQRHAPGDSQQDGTRFEGALGFYQPTEDSRSGVLLGFGLAAGVVGVGLVIFRKRLARLPR